MTFIYTLLIKTHVEHSLCQTQFEQMLNGLIPSHKPCCVYVPQRSHTSSWPSRLWMSWTGVWSNWRHWKRATRSARWRPTRYFKCVRHCAHTHDTVWQRCNTPKGTHLSPGKKLIHHLKQPIRASSQPLCLSPVYPDSPPWGIFSVMCIFLPDLWSSDHSSFEHGRGGVLFVQTLELVQHKENIIFHWSFLRM